MGLLDVELMENLLHSSSFSKGIERTMERIINELEIDSMFIIHHEPGVTLPEIVFEWDNKDDRVLCPLEEYVDNIQNWYHFEESDLFVARATTVLSGDEKEMYRNNGYEAVVEYQMTNHGNIVGYIVVAWNKIRNLSEEDVSDLHILFKVMNEVLLREFHRGVLNEGEAGLFRLTSSMTSTAIYMLDEELKITYVNSFARDTFPNIKAGDNAVLSIWGEEGISDSNPLVLVEKEQYASANMYIPHMEGNYFIAVSKIRKSDNRDAYVMVMRMVGRQDIVSKRAILGKRFIFAMESLYKQVIAVELRKDIFYDLFETEMYNNKSYSMEFVLKWLGRVHLDDRKKFVECFDLNYLQNTYMNGEQKKEIDFRYRTEEGNYHCMNGQLIFVQNTNKEVTVYILFQDIEQVRSRQIDEERKLRDSLLAARSAAELKTGILANISHEIRNPLSGIVSMSSVARQVYKNEERLLECLSNIDDYAEHMTTVMDRILDIVNVDEDAIVIAQTPFRLDSMLNRIDVSMREKIEKKNINFKVNTEGQYNQLIGDSVRLQQALTYLLNNCVSYTPISGNITLTARQVAVDKKTVYIRFVLEDTGSGLTDKMKNSIFGFDNDLGVDYEEQYYDLTLASRLIQLMGGQIGVRVDAAGTHLDFSIPFVLQEGEQKKATKKKFSPAAGKFEGKRILVAEDDELGQDALSAVLEVAGFQVDIVENGRKAVVQFVSQPPHTYDAILMDIHMPHMDGREATRCIRISGKEDGEEIPVIGLMANAGDEDVEQSLQSGMQEQLSKPVDVETLYKVLQRLIPEIED